MHKPTIQFSHANGFPAPCYKSLFDHLKNDFEIRYIENLGHNPKFPVTDNWASLVDELIQDIEQSATLPLIGVGHSLGGAITLFAALKRPNSFLALFFWIPLFFLILKPR